MTRALAVGFLVTLLVVAGLATYHLTHRLPALTSLGRIA